MALSHDEISGLYDHLQAAMKLLGIEWKSDQPLSPGMLAAYVRKGNHTATLATGTRLPEGISGEDDTAGNSAATELVLVARAIALHLSTTAFHVCEDAQVVWTWDEPTEFFCRGTYQAHESLNSCARCSMHSFCDVLANTPSKAAGEIATVVA